MQKKLIALAVAGLVSGGAFAQASNVTIYGRANIGFDSYSATGSAGGAASDFRSRNRVYDQGSRLGFRGTEDLGGGMKASFVFESGVNLDTGSANGQSGAGNASSGTLASRSSWLELAGNFGMVRAGRQDLYWGDGSIYQFNANYVNMGVVMSAGSLGHVNGPTARTSNTITYTTPNMSGFTGMIGYIAGSEAVAVNLPTNGNGASFRLTYANGPITVYADHTYLTTADTAAVTAAGTGTVKNYGTKIGAGWDYAPGSKLGLIWIQHRNDNIAAATVAGFSNAGDDLKQSAWQANWEHTFGNLQVLAAHGRAGNVSGNTGVALTGDSKSRQTMIGARYFLSKRTTVYGTYNTTSNGDMNWNDYAAAGYSSAGAAGLAAANRGADPKVVAIGVMHNF